MVDGKEKKTAKMKFWQKYRIHYGLISDDLECAVQKLKLLGGMLLYALIDSKRQVKLAFVDLRGTLVEVVEPLGESSPVFNLLKKRGAHIYHTCVYVDDISQKIKELEVEGFLLIEPPSPAKAFDGNKVAFLYHNKLGVIELLEYNSLS